MLAVTFARPRPRRIPPGVAPLFAFPLLRPPTLARAALGVAAWLDTRTVASSGGGVLRADAPAIASMSAKRSRSIVSGGCSSACPLGGRARLRAAALRPPAARAGGVPCGELASPARTTASMPSKSSSIPGVARPPHEAGGPRDGRCGVLDATGPAESGTAGSGASRTQAAHRRGPSRAATRARTLCPRLPAWRHRVLHCAAVCGARPKGLLSSLRMK